MFADATGVGRAAVDILRQSGTPHVCPVTITGGMRAGYQADGRHVPKVVLASAVQSKLHSGDLEIPSDLPEREMLMRELQEFRATFTPSGNATFGARVGEHDDLVLALSMAVLGVDHQRRVRTMPLRG